MKLEEVIKSQPISDVHLKAMLDIIHTASVISYKQYKFFKQFDISPQQYNILRILRGSQPEPLTFQEIKSRMLERTPHTTRMIDKLESAGLVYRERSHSDRRKIFVHIAREGLKIMDRIDKKLPGFMEPMRNLSASEAKLLSGLLEKFRG